MLKNTTPTKKQIEIYNFIKSFIADMGYSPTIKEIRDGVDLRSTASVHYQLVKMVTLEMIDFKPESPRTVRVLEWENNIKFPCNCEHCRVIRGL